MTIFYLFDYLLYLQDCQRVLNRFQGAANRNVVVEQGSVCISDILNHLHHHGPIIVLTNAHLLRCNSCAKSMPQLRSCLPCAPPYQGHYVVLVGYRASSATIFYRNPSFKDRICSMSFSALDEARQSYGTDEDIIFIYDSP